MNRLARIIHPCVGRNEQTRSVPELRSLVSVRLRAEGKTRWYAFALFRQPLVRPRSGLREKSRLDEGQTNRQQIFDIGLAEPISARTKQHFFEFHEEAGIRRTLSLPWFQGAEHLRAGNGPQLALLESVNPIFRLLSPEAQKFIIRGLGQARQKFSASFARDFEGRARTAPIS